MSFTLLTFQTGMKVVEEGWYVCVPCGYKKFFKKGMRFPRCIKCFGGQGKEFMKGLELWEKFEASTRAPFTSEI